MMFIYDYSHGGLLDEAQFLTGFVPELMAVCEDFRRFHAVHDDAAIVSKNGQHLCHNFFQFSSMSANKNGIRAW